MIFQPGESIGRTGYGLYIDWENEQTRKTSIIFDIPEMVGRLFITKNLCNLSKK
jgi:hypothetical protein